MLPGGAGGLTVDGGRALRLAAVVALVVLGLITLPDLFRAPEPPPLPPDVGFRPGETTAPVPAGPGAGSVAGRPAETVSRIREGGRNTKPRSEPEKRNDRRKRDSPARPRDPAPKPEPVTKSPPSAAPSPSPTVPAPAPSPPPAAPAWPAPADGSEEFAPGLSG